MHDFEPLLPAEQTVLRAAATGDIARIGLRRPRTPSPALRLRGSFLGFLARGGGDGAPVRGRRLQILGGFIDGRVDLAFAHVPMSLWLYRCTFGTAPLLDGARVAGNVAFADCAMPGLHAQACRIDGELALNAGCHIDGDVLLMHACVGRDLNCERMHLRGSARDSTQARQRRLVADGARIGGDVLLIDGFDAAGEVRFMAARVGGDFRAEGARLAADLDASGARGVALDLDRARVGGNVRLCAGFSAAGQVRLQRARIDGDLDCGGAAFDAAGDASWGDNGAALLLDRARIGGALNLRQLQGPLQGASLADARAGALLDDASTWGRHHVLDGFRYTRLAGGAPTDAPMRLDWLARQHAAHLGADYRPDPWRRLIKVLRRMGRGPSASAVAVGRERHLRRAGLIGLGAPPGLRWLARLGHAAYGALAGYGHRPLRMLASVAVVWLVCAALYGAAADRGALAPNATLLLADPRLAQCRPHCKQLPLTVAPFQPLLYSLDVLLPLVDLRQQHHWVPARGALGSEVEAWIGTPPLLLLVWAEALSGWIATLVLLASLAGWPDRDRAR
ncbi:MAG: hypothetical protein KGL99_06325 [Burkholderiales bacterium]|nr:hypothetical protein [Burkholderiales bacterium]